MHWTLPLEDYDGYGKISAEEAEKNRIIISCGKGRKVSRAYPDAHANPDKKKESFNALKGKFKIK